MCAHSSRTLLCRGAPRSSAQPCPACRDPACTAAHWHPALAAALLDLARLGVNCAVLLLSAETARGGS